MHCPFFRTALLIRVMSSLFGPLYGPFVEAGLHTHAEQAYSNHAQCQNMTRNLSPQHKRQRARVLLCLLSLHITVCVVNIIKHVNPNPELRVLWALEVKWDAILFVGVTQGCPFGFSSRARVGVTINAAPKLNSLNATSLKHCMI